MAAILLPLPHLGARCYRVAIWQEGSTAPPTHHAACTTTSASCHPEAGVSPPKDLFSSALAPKTKSRLAPRCCSHSIYPEYQPRGGKPDTFPNFIFPLLSSPYDETDNFCLLTTIFVFCEISHLRRPAYHLWGAKPRSLLVRAPIRHENERSHCVRSCPIIADNPSCVVDPVYVVQRRG